MSAVASSPYTPAVPEAAATWRYTTAMTVPVLAAEMVDPTWRDADGPLIQFSMDSRRFPDQRHVVLAEAPHYLLNEDSKINL